MTLHVAQRYTEVKDATEEIVVSLPKSWKSDDLRVWLLEQISSLVDKQSLTTSTNLFHQGLDRYAKQLYFDTFLKYLPVMERSTKLPSQERQQSFSIGRLDAGLDAILDNSFDLKEVISTSGFRMLSCQSYRGSIILVALGSWSSEV